MEIFFNSYNFNSIINLIVSFHLEYNFSTVVKETVHDIHGTLVRHHADEESEEPR